MFGMLTPHACAVDSNCVVTVSRKTGGDFPSPKLMSFPKSHCPSSEHSTQDQDNSSDFVVPFPPQHQLLGAPRLLTVYAPLLVERISQSNYLAARASELVSSDRKRTVSAA